MKNPCEGCAFTGEASLDPRNRLRSEICALTGVPFFCHHGLNWKTHIGVRRGMAFDMDGNSRPLQVCTGWAERIRHSQLPRGSDQKSWLGRIVRHAKGQAALELLEEATQAEPSEKPELYARLRKALKHLRRPFSMREKVTLPS